MQSATNKFPSPEPAQAQEWTEAERAKAAEQKAILQQLRKNL